MVSLQRESFSSVIRCSIYFAIIAVFTSGCFHTDECPSGFVRDFVEAPNDPENERVQVCVDTSVNPPKKCSPNDTLMGLRAGKKAYVSCDLYRDQKAQNSSHSSDKSKQKSKKKRKSKR